MEDCNFRLGKLWQARRPLLLGLLTFLAGCPGTVPSSYDTVPPLDSAKDQTATDWMMPDALLTDLDDLSSDQSDTQLPSPCASQTDDITVALYTFEGTGSTITDVGGLGQNPGQIHGAGVSRIDSKQGCGKALYVPQMNDHYVEIPHSSSWLLDDGAVDLWVRFDELSGVQPNRGIISRDASGTNQPNHLTIYRACDNAIVLRYQLSGDDHHYQCSEPVTDETWHHVGVNFGSEGLELVVNGQVASRDDAVKEYSDGSCVDSTTNVCGRTSDQGIAGNENPWVVGSTSMGSAEGAATPVGNPLGGAIDSVRISSAPRDF